MDSQSCVDGDEDLSRKDSCLSNISSVDSLAAADDANELDELSDEATERQLRAHRSTSVESDESEGGRDSGIEGEKEPEMIIPDQDLIDRIVTQVEIYFSDSNVSKDKFLLKHIRRNKEGFVSLKLVSSFKKVKQLTKDWRVVSHALSKGSVGIEINDLGTKIRRTAPLPEIDETPVTCTILALNLPIEKPTIDSVSQLFGQCGDIALIRVLRAGAPLSAEMKQLSSKYPALNETNCAWIEFDVPEAVKEACKLSTEEGMNVVPIPVEAGKKTGKNTGNKSQGNSRKNSVASNSGSTSKSNNSSRKNSFNSFNNRQNNNRNNFEQNYYPGNFSSFGGRHPQRRKAVSLQHSERPNLRDLTVITEGGGRRPKSKSCIEVPTAAAFYPHQQTWLQRHLFAAAVNAANSAAAMAAGPMMAAYQPMAASPTIVPTMPPRRPTRTSLGLPEGVARLPKGPDGSRGFGFRRNKEESSM